MGEAGAFWETEGLSRVEQGERTKGPGKTRGGGNENSRRGGRNGVERKAERTRTQKKVLEIDGKEKEVRAAVTSTRATRKRGL